MKTEIDEFVRGLVAESDRVSIGASLALVSSALTGFCTWAHTVRGLPLSARLLFNPRTIDLYLRDAQLENELGKRLEKGTVATYGSVLRAFAKATGADDGSQIRALGARDAKAPYTQEEIDTFRVWARTRQGKTRIAQAEALIALGFGAGLHGGEIRTIRTRDIRRTGGVAVTIPGGARRAKSSTVSLPRTVPVLRVWSPVLLAAIADLDPDDYVFSRRPEPGDADAITRFVDRSGVKQPKTPVLKLNGYRMRTTWVVGRLAAGVDIRALLAAAGLQRLENLADYLAFVPELDPKIAAAQLRRPAPPDAGVRRM